VSAEEPTGCWCVSCGASGQNDSCGNANEAKRALSVLLASQEFHALRKQTQEEGNFHLKVSQASVWSNCCSETEGQYRIVVGPAYSEGDEALFVVATVDVAAREILELHTNVVSNNVVPLEAECWPTYCYDPEPKGPGCWCYWCWWWCCEGPDCWEQYGCYYCFPENPWCNCWS
jgi:hypothetical protein